MKIWIDADAAPRDVKDLLFRVAVRRQLFTILVANSTLTPPAGNPFVSFVLVPGGPDVADRYITEQSVPGDLAITADIPLAAALVEKGVTVLDPRGLEYSAANIGERLAMRHLMDELRQTGAVTGGPDPYGPRERAAFASKLEQVLARKSNTGSASSPARKFDHLL